MTTGGRYHIVPAREIEARVAAIELRLERIEGRIETVIEVLTSDRPSAVQVLIPPPPQAPREGSLAPVARALGQWRTRLLLAVGGALVAAAAAMLERCT